MTKRVKSLLVIGIFILSMAVVMLLLVLTQPKGDTEEDTSKTNTSSGLSIVNYQRDDVSTVTIRNEYGEFTVKNTPSGFTIEEFAGFRQNSTIMSAMARCASSLSGRALVEENAAELGKYGLADGSPVAECEVTLYDGTNYTLYFGINAPDGETRYVRRADSKDVYTAVLNSTGYFYYDSSDYLSLVVTDELTNNNTAPTIDWMTVTRKDLDYDIRFEDDTKNYAIDEVSMPSSQVMIEPVYAHLDITNSNAVLYGIWGLTAADIACVHPTEEDLAKYGLDDPFCTVDYDCELQNYHMDIGNVASYELDDTGAETSVPATYYCIYRGIDIVYIFETSEIPWVSFMPIDILSSSMTGNYIYNIDHMDIEFYEPEQASYHFEISGNEEDAIVYCNLDGNDNYESDDFKALYLFILRCPIDDIYFIDPPDDALIARIEIICREGYGQDIIEFYDIGANRVAIKLNGRTSFSQPRGYLNVLKQNIDAFKGGAKKGELQEIW